jgi:hypothetical protein
MDKYLITLPAHPCYKCISKLSHPHENIDLITDGFIYSRIFNSRFVLKVYQYIYIIYQYTKSINKEFPNDNLLCFVSLSVTNWEKSIRASMTRQVFYSPGEHMDPITVIPQWMLVLLFIGWLRTAMFNSPYNYLYSPLMHFPSSELCQSPDFTSALSNTIMRALCVLNGRG